MLLLLFFNLFKFLNLVFLVFLFFSSFLRVLTYLERCGRQSPAIWHRSGPNPTERFRAMVKTLNLSKFKKLYCSVFSIKFKVLSSLKRSGRLVGFISPNFGPNLTDWDRVMTKNHLGEFFSSGVGIPMNSLLSNANSRKK